MQVNLPNISYVISDDKMNVTLTIDDKKYEIQVIHLESLINWLGKLRADMNPPVPATSPSDAKQCHHLSSLFVSHLEGTSCHPCVDGAAFLAKSENFGWLHFQADADFCRGLVSWLNGLPKNIVVPKGATIN